MSYTAQVDVVYSSSNLINCLLLFPYTEISENNIQKFLDVDSTGHLPQFKHSQPAHIKRISDAYQTHCMGHQSRKTYRNSSAAASIGKLHLKNLSR
jgi:hypothetical protein